MLWAFVNLLQTYVQATLDSMVTANRILLTTIVSFGKAAFPEFRRLSRENQVTLAVEYCTICKYAVAAGGQFLLSLSALWVGLSSGQALPGGSRTVILFSLVPQIQIIISSSVWLFVEMLRWCPSALARAKQCTSSDHNDIRLFAGYTSWYTHNYDENFFNDCRNAIDVEQVKSWVLTLFSFWFWNDLIADQCTPSARVATCECVRWWAGWDLRRLSSCTPSR